ncbi:hypothetical protein EN851_28090 [Mesorhizobium sp. M8A.F.Ca.ET.208.01.1.1]|nr:hypothetical protein EOA35_11110 [Mesorhizobium sp. M8A.F.Ca.ET.023.01.1.1]RWC74263.1 MAG: hypothetical protein EOS71_14345 [Mesorhizobium sp.]TGQ77688.1 hypothetical protein EN850_25860 [Mesorhizobium sp. M8A.F.Ca.ET.207.01.1.1]TGQ87864.1 hypothetical protein EN851_28090 [Mesorhizobium sp. M8A.F.Ca.ET.208.01.1.1]TGT49594.1 hypothetical protein EN810_27990 [Mesorhizobium sp. M8A.F.Ca.ET.167.01.1.1]
MSAREHPPLSCRTSPPQGGRLAVCALRLFFNAEDWRNPARHLIAPLEGEMSGRTEGGATELGLSCLPRFAGARKGANS